MKLNKLLLFLCRETTVTTTSRPLSVTPSCPGPKVTRLKSENLSERGTVKGSPFTASCNFSPYQTKRTTVSLLNFLILMLQTWQTICSSFKQTASVCICFPPTASACTCRNQNTHRGKHAVSCSFQQLEQDKNQPQIRSATSLMLRYTLICSFVSGKKDRPVLLLKEHLVKE